MSRYLLELTIIHLTLILGYWIFLRKERQYGKMRFYLLASSLLALIIPLIKLPLPFYHGRELINIGALEEIPINAMTGVMVKKESGGSINLIFFIYLTISGFFLLKLLGNVAYLLYLDAKSSYEKFNDRYVRRVRNIKGSFTFFNWIFLSHDIDKNQADYQVILQHEKAHATLGHTYDLIFLEVFRAFFWWLPTAWFVNKEIRKIHEYQADACALKSCSVNQYSSILISSTLKSNGLNLASSFHDGLILKRLKAMKQKTKILKAWKLGVLGSLPAILLVVFACTEEPQMEKEAVVSEVKSIDQISEDEVFTKVEVDPAFDGGSRAFYEHVAGELKYPPEASKLGVEGRVYVQFIVEKNGSISNVKLLQGIGAGCDEEAVRVVKNAPSWKPGLLKGEPVRVKLVLPITFKLGE